MFPVKGKHEKIRIYSKLQRRWFNGSEEKGNYSKRQERGRAMYRKQDSGIPEIFGCGVLNPNTQARIQVPLTKIPESSSWNPKSAALNPKSKTAFDSVTWGEKCFQ